MKIRLSDFMQALSSLPKNPPKGAPYCIFIPQYPVWVDSKAMPTAPPPGYTAHIRWDGEAWQIQNPIQITLIP